MNTITQLLQPHFQEFLQTHQHHPDLQQLALQAKKFPMIDITLAINQLKGKQKAKHKLPTWFDSSQVLYPSLLAMEQCSSEMTAAWKANWLMSYLRQEVAHKAYRAADLTGGFGVDTWYLSQHCTDFCYVEQQSELAALVKHNFEVLQTKNIQVTVQNANNFLEQLVQPLDFIYLDPARRNEHQQKVFHLSDCEPNLLDLAPLLSQKTAVVLLKLSPILDIHLAMEQLPHLQQIAVVAVENECKELLFLLDFTKEPAKNVCITTVNIQKNKTTQEFSFQQLTEKELTVAYDLPQMYLYEPNVAVLKAGAFKSIAHAYRFKKLHLHSHLYTSSELVSAFVGRVFEVKGSCKLDKKVLLHQLGSDKANLTVRNFPLSVAEIRKKTGLKEGGETYLFATTLADGSKVLLITNKIS